MLKVRTGSLAVGRKGMRKAGYQQSIRINISLPPALDQRKQELCQKFAMASFSDWVQAHMRKDLGIELAA